MRDPEQHQETSGGNGALPRCPGLSHPWSPGCPQARGALSVPRGDTRVLPTTFSRCIGAPRGSGGHEVDSRALRSALPFPRMPNRGPDPRHVRLETRQPDP